MKVLSLFSGIGAFEKALENLNVSFDLVNYCEVDKYASKSFAVVHGVSEDKNLGDITKVNTDKLPNDIDLITYGFPCQDLSLAGKKKGFINADGSSTRSGLFYEALRLIEDLKPRIAIAENVKNLVSNKFKKDFEIVLQSLENIGYNNYWKVLNSKDYGIPQNRERVFIVSIRKDFDDGTFKFPKIDELTVRLKDFLECEVDDKFYLSDKLINQILHWKAYQKPFEKVLGFNSVCPTLTARGAGENHSGMIIYGESLENTTNLEPIIKFKNDSIPRLRKLTPKECWRLMGFDDESYERVASIPTSNAQLYKQAGNSIVVNVLQKIFVNVLPIINKEKEQVKKGE